VISKAALRRKIDRRRRQLANAEHAFVPERVRQSYNRAALFERDRGVCAHCKEDMEVVKRRYEQSDWLDKQIILQDFAIPISRANSDFWDGHHVQEIVAGGDSKDLSNIITLCLKCHRVETDKLAARKAKAVRVASKFNDSRE